MDLKSLRYVVAIAKEQNITKAAQKLFISQSSLSHALSSIEKEIGLPLFSRQKSGVTLTAAGEKYYAAAKQMLKIYDHLLEELQNPEENTKIQIATSSVWGTQLFSTLIPKFREKHPEASFDLTQAEMYYLEAEIKEGTVDFGFITLSPYEKLSPQMKILRKEPFQFAVPARHPYVALNPGSSLHLEDIPKHFQDSTFLISRVGSPNRDVAEHLFEELSFTPKRISEVNGLSLTLSMVANSLDVAFMPLSGCAKEERVHYYELEPELFRYNVLLAKPLANYNDLQKAFYRFALSFYQDGRKEKG